MIVEPTPHPRRIRDSDRAPESLARFKLTYRGLPNPGTYYILAKDEAAARSFYLGLHGIPEVAGDPRLICTRLPD